MPHGEPHSSRERGGGHSPGETVQPVVLAGGSGTRLWPLSRVQRPKQFLALSGPLSLFQQSLGRLSALADTGLRMAPPCVVCAEEQRFLVLDQLLEMGITDATLLLEPSARNTAPAMSLAAWRAVQDGADPVLLVTPSDQTVADTRAFCQALREAVRIASRGAIALLGIQPDRPEAGYGYILADRHDDGAGRPIQRFAEKPALAQAQRWVADGGWFWNSGIFVVRASVWLSLLQRHRDDLAAATEAAWAARRMDGCFLRPGPDEFARIPAISVDHAVLVAESTSIDGRVDMRMVPMQAGWNDLGSWQAVWQAGTKDAQGNASVGDALVQGSRNTLVHATGRLVAVVGMDDVVVVETADAVLVVSQAHAQDIRDVVGELQRRGRPEPTVHRQVHRPWGWYDSIDAGPRFQVKRIVVKPGASLSLQMHHHRAEHWVVVRGTAEVTCGNCTTLLSENQSTYIPLGEKHRLSNPGKVPLEIIEVQSGSYLGEDDIVRFGDSYGRT